MPCIRAESGSGDVQQRPTRIGPPKFAVKHTRCLVEAMAEAVQELRLLRHGREAMRLSML